MTSVGRAIPWDVIGLNSPVVGMSDHLASKVARALDRLRDRSLTGEPDWEPLERVLPAAWCGAFMWMTRAVQRKAVIELYKHGITRRYLNLDHRGRAWRYDSASNTYRSQPLTVAIELVYRDIEVLEAERSTVYYTAYVSARIRKFRDRGWEVVM